MLINDFFYITKNIQQSEDKIVASVKINPAHQIFRAHFPGNPVVPGVVSIQMINEILSEYLGKKLMLLKARNIKFPAMINPYINPELHFNIDFHTEETENIKVNAQIFFEETIFIKFTGYFTSLNN